MSMVIWSASAIGRYYLDPTIEFLKAGNREKPSAAGYYISPHCGPDCCPAFGGVVTINLGPFATRAKARNWSRIHLTKGEAMACRVPRRPATGSA